MGNNLSGTIDLTLIAAVVGGGAFVVYTIQNSDVQGMLDKFMDTVNQFEGSMISHLGDLSGKIADEIPAITRNIVHGVVGVWNGVADGIGQALNPSDANTFGQWWNALFGHDKDQKDPPFHVPDKLSVLYLMKGIIDIKVKQDIQKKVSATLQKYYSGPTTMSGGYSDETTNSILSSIKQTKPEKIGWYTSLVTVFVTRYYYNKHYLGKMDDNAKAIYNFTEDDVFTYFFLLIVGGEFYNWKPPKKKNLTYHVLFALREWGRHDAILGTFEKSSRHMIVDSLHMMYTESIQGINAGYDLRFFKDQPY